MKEENRKYAELAYDLVKDAENMGSRLPGSEGERKYADFMGSKLEEIGTNAKNMAIIDATKRIYETLCEIVK